MLPYSNDWSLGECLRALYRRKGTLAALTCLGILGAAAITAVQPRSYRSHASLEIQPFNEGYLDLRDIYPSASPAADAIYIQTQAEMIQQDSLLEQVSRKLHLENRPEYRAPGGVLARLRQDVRVIPVRNSRIVLIVSDAPTPSLAADLANALAGAFIDQGIEERQRGAWRTYQALLPQLAELRRTLHPSSRPGSEVDRRFYDATLERAYRAWLGSRLASSNIRLIGPATPPPAPNRPNIPLNLALGTIGGLLLGVAGVMLQEQHKSVLRAPGEAGTCLELPELGAIPQAGSWMPSAFFFTGSDNSRLRTERAALEQQSGFSESFRATVASILASGRGAGQARVLVVTSCQPMEGKTTVVSHLGMALAATSRKVLMIDGDMRRPRLHKLFDQANSWGLSDVLSEKNAIDELPLDALAKKTSVPHLYLLPSGASTDNVFGLLHSGRMSRLLPLFREEFDYVLVDAPPCQEFADARIMASYAEELLLVVRANHTDRRAVQAAVERLRLDGIPLMGVILNRWAAAPGDPYCYRTSRSPLRQGVS
jgi:succinoglycan biosynthesis transport protein ExoP